MPNTAEQIQQYTHPVLIKLYVRKHFALGGRKVFFWHYTTEQCF